MTKKFLFVTVMSGIIILLSCLLLVVLSGILLALCTVLFVHAVALIFAFTPPYFYIAAVSASAFTAAMGIYVGYKGYVKFRLDNLQREIMARAQNVPQSGESAQGQE